MKLSRAVLQWQIRNGGKPEDLFLSLTSVDPQPSDWQSVRAKSLMRLVREFVHRKPGEPSDDFPRLARWLGEHADRLPRPQSHWTYATFRKMHDRDLLDELRDERRSSGNVAWAGEVTVPELCQVDLKVVPVRSVHELSLLSERFANCIRDDRKLYEDPLKNGSAVMLHITTPEGESLLWLKRDRKRGGKWSMSDHKGRFNKNPPDDHADVADRYVGVMNWLQFGEVPGFTGSLGKALPSGSGWDDVASCTPCAES